MPLLADPTGFAGAVDGLAAWAKPLEPELVLGAEARGFILGAPLATRIGAGFIPLRKPGKLPWESVAEKYALEYGEDSLEAHRDACTAGDRVLIADDVLATGGTAAAAGNLVRRLGAELVGWTILLEIGVLKGHEKLVGARWERLVGV
jgi:adenine phosphoribosyltransferase